MQFSRVNWGSIFAGAFCALGVLLCFGFLARALGINGPLVFPAAGVPLTADDFRPGFWGSIFAVFASSASFFVGGFVTATLGAFARSLSSVLHGLAAFSVATFAIHFGTLDAMFLARPGYLPFGPLRNPLPALEPNQNFLIFLACLSAAVFAGAGAYWAWANRDRRAVTAPNEREHELVA